MSTGLIFYIYPISNSNDIIILHNKFYTNQMKVLINITAECSYYNTIYIYRHTVYKLIIYQIDAKTHGF